MKDLIKEGYYKVKVKSYGANETSKGTPKAWVKFDNGLFWQGFITDTEMNNGKTVAQSTVEQLVFMGFQGKDLNDLNKENALNTSEEFDVEVKHRVTDKGLTVAEVAWVSTNTRKEVAPDVQSRLKKVDLRAHVKEAMNFFGVNKKPNQKSNQPEFTADDIPF